MPTCIKHKIELHEELEVCPECVEEAALKNMANFGEAKTFYCGTCGREFSKERFIAHQNAWGGRC